MKSVVLSDGLIMSVSDKQKIDYKKEYRLINYSIETKYDNGYLIFNIVNNCLIYLSNSEYERIFQENDYINNDVFVFLVENWFLVPIEFNDKNFVDNIYTISRLISLKNHGSISDELSHFTIFPTTDCNARCFYCFENGIQHISMDEKTARDVADFIIKKAPNKQIKIKWFGGEPLYNQKAIEIICSRLQENNIDFISTMTTNGYLFDKNVVKNALDQWKLKKVQITLDGTEKVYNRIKSYIYKDTNPFEKVLNNIQLLLEAKIDVVIRLNVDFHNFHDIISLLALLNDKFSKYNNLVIYPHPLYENSTKMHLNRTVDDRKEVVKIYNEVKQIIENYGFSNLQPISSRIKFQQCMADNPSSTTILPDGNLGKCDYHTNIYWGSIYSDEIDYDVIKRFSLMSEKKDKCAFCPLYPQCNQLAMCPGWSKNCEEFDMEARVTLAKKRMILSYDKYCNDKKI